MHTNRKTKDIHTLNRISIAQVIMQRRNNATQGLTYKEAFRFTGLPEMLTKTK